MKNYKAIDDVVAIEGFSAQQVFMYWLKQGKIILPEPDNEIYMTNNEVKFISLSKENLHLIKPGMLWFYDDTFSFYVVENKPIKAIVELVERRNIYGDLTVNSIFEIKEKRMSWHGARGYIRRFVFDCKKKERIVWYTIKQLEKIEQTYSLLVPTFEVLGKKARHGSIWASDDIEVKRGGAWVKEILLKRTCLANIESFKYGYVRPVIVRSL